MLRVWVRRVRVRVLKAELERLRSASACARREIQDRDEEIARLRAQVERMQGGIDYWARQQKAAREEAERLRGDLATAAEGNLTEAMCGHAPEDRCIRCVTVSELLQDLGLAPPAAESRANRQER